MSREWTTWWCAKFKFEGLSKNQNAGLTVVKIANFMSELDFNSLNNIFFVFKVFYKLVV